MGLHTHPSNHRFQLHAFPSNHGSLYTSTHSNLYTHPTPPHHEPPIQPSDHRSLFYTIPHNHGFLYTFIQARLSLHTHPIEHTLPTTKPLTFYPPNRTLEPVYCLLIMSLDSSWLSSIVMRPSPWDRVPATCQLQSQRMRMEHLLIPAESTCYNVSLGQGSTAGQQKTCSPLWWVTAAE